MKTIAKTAVAARADRLNQPEMLEAYSEMAIAETDTHYELTEADWRELNTLWDEKRSKTHKASGRSCPWKELCNEIREFGDDKWMRELNRLEEWIKNRTGNTGCHASNEKVQKQKEEFRTKWKKFKIENNPA